jgi:hypothetical protein
VTGALVRGGWYVGAVSGLEHDVMRFDACIDDGLFSSAKIAQALLTTKAEIAETLGPAPETLAWGRWAETSETQTRLWDMIEILSRVEAVNGSLLGAYAWFRSEPLPGFGGRTPDGLVRAGRARHVHAYFDRPMAGSGAYRGSASTGRR